MRSQAAECGGLPSRMIHYLLTNGRAVARLCRSTPLVVAALVVASGAASTTLAVVDVARWRALPFKDPARLIDIAQPGLDQGTLTALSPYAYLELRRSAAAFEGVGAIRLNRQLHFEADGVGELINARLVSTNLFDLLGLTPAAGQFFGPEHDGPGGRLFAVLSYGAWSKRFNRSPEVVGQVLRFRDGPRTIVGVLPEGVSLPLITGPDAEVYLPYVPDASEAQNRRTRSMFVIARMRDHVSLAEAQKAIGGFGPGVVTTLEARARGNWSKWFTFIVVSVGLAYATALLSLAVALMTQGLQRAHEYAIRKALGATQRRLVLDLCAMVTSVTLLTGVAGLGLAVWGVEFLRAYLLHELPRANEIGISLRVAGIAIAASTLFGFLISIAPLALKPRSLHASGEIPRATTSRRSVVLMRSSLILQAALVAFLLVCSSLVVASYVRFNKVDLGFDYQNVFLIPYSSRPASQDTTLAHSSTVRSELIRQLSREQTVAEVAVTLGSVPLSGGSTKYSVRIPGESSFGDERMIVTSMVTAGFFETLRIPLIGGRLFSDDDRRGGGRVAVINEAANGEWFGAEGGLGRDIDLNGMLRIVGVVKSVLPNGPEAPPQPTVYTLIDQDPFAAGVGTGTVIGRLRTGDRQAVASVREIMRVVVGTDIPPAGFLEESFQDLAKTRRFNAFVTLALATLAVLVATAAVYGNTKFLVTSRRHDFAIRLALGAPPSRLLLATVTTATLTVTLGALVGLGAASLVTRSMQALVFDVAPSDWRIYVGSLVLIVIAAIAATVGPGREAGRTDPLESFRK